MAVAIVAGGCANTEELSGRRPEEYKNYSGTPYASDAVNEANLFGTEGNGLSSNPATKPSGALLGSYDASIGPVTVKVVPTEVKAKTNEIIEVNVELSALSEEDGKTEVPVPKPMQIVVVLESGDMEANGSLVWSSKDSAGATLNENGAYSNKLVLTTSKDGKAKFRVQTGTLYNMTKPMYWLNVWSANADAPGSMAIHVQRPPRIGDPGLSEGSLDVFNDPSLDPVADEDILGALTGSRAVAAEMTPKLNTHQELFVDAEKTFSVRLVGTLDDGTASSSMRPLPDEVICWKVVTDDSNDGNVISTRNEKEGKRCARTDENGDVEVVFWTGKVYNTKYYLNFYHEVASPIAFEIVTFVMPETLGTDGAPIGASDFLKDDGTLPEGMIVDLPPEEELETSPAGYPMMTTKDSQKVLEKIAETDVKLAEVLDENCYDTDRNFVCNLVQDESGTWTIWKQASCTDEDGNVRYVASVKECNENEKATGAKPVIADMDGDGVKENVSLVIEEVYTGTDRGKPIIFVDDEGQAYYIDDDGNRVNVDLIHDDDGKTYYEDDDGNRHELERGGVFTGYDTTGDGTANTVPDPCTVDSNRPGCSGETTLEFRCSRDGGQSFVGGCGVQSYGIQEDVDIRTQLVDKDKVGSNNQSVSYELLRSADERNNGAFKGGTSETEANARTSTYAHKSGASHDGVSSVVFHTGTAHSSAYYVTVINAQAHPVSYSYYIKYSVKLPTGEGDSPSHEDLEQAMNEPPADMPDKDPSVGSVLLVADGATAYNTVIAKTLILKARVVDANTKRPYNGTDVYWKVVRGASESNNGVLKNTKSKTDSQGYAMNEFFTGTGYDSTYYAIAYHPNCEQEPRDPEQEPCEPLVFTIHTENFSGTVDGPTGDPTSPCDPETDAHACKAVFPCKDDPSKECEEGDPNANTDDGPTKVEGLDVVKKYPAGPDALCTDAELLKINKCIAGTDTACDLGEGREKGCLLFELLSNEDGAGKDTPTSSPGDEVRQAYTNKKEQINARLSWFDGSGWQIVDSRLYWTLDKSADADGSLMYMKTLHSDDNMATNILKTGSAETKYRVNISFPNIYTCDDYTKYENCKLEPLSTVVNVQSADFVDSENYPANTLNLTFNKEIKTVSDEPIKDIGNVEIYIVSSDLNTCRTSFVLQPKAKRKAEYATMQTGRNPKISNDLTWDVLTDNGKSYEIADQRESLLIYTIATDNAGNPIAYNCTENLSFPIKKKLPEKCKEYGEKCDTDAHKEANADLCDACTNVINKEITLTEVPTSVEGTYSTKTLFDIGPLLANEENVVHKKLMELAELYKETFGSENGSKSVGELLVGSLFDVLFFHTTGDQKQTNEEKCIQHFCKQWGPPYDINLKCQNEYTQANGLLTLPENVQKDGLHYKSCSCLCAKTYYYTQYNKLGGMLEPLARKGLTTLVNNLLGADDMSMDEMICSILDSIQFIEFTGNVSLKGTSSSTQAFEGAFEYSGFVTPSVAGKNLSPDSNMSVIRGKWASSSYENNQLTFNNVPIMLSYGKLAYQILGSLIGMDEYGKADLLKVIDCDSLFAHDLSLPVLGQITAEGLQSLCTTFLEVTNGKIFEIADAKEASTNIVFDVGTAMAEGKSSKCTDGKCQAKTLINGTWEGRGSFKATDADGQISTKKYDAAALWLAAIDKAGLEGLAYNTGDDEKDLDAWKKERSVCALILNQAAARVKVEEQITGGNPTNRACLGGTFNGDSSERRDPEVNFCKLDGCQNNPSIVVCTTEMDTTTGKEKGVFNEKYANASQETILSDAMASCYKAYHEATGDADKATIEKACNKNAEVEGWNNPVTNVACKKNQTDGTCTGACADESNISIVVCGAKDGSGKLCFNKDDGYACYRKNASKACFTNGCGGDCMNNLSEAVVCGEREDHVLAVWTNFDGNGSIVSDDGKDLNKLADYVKAGLKPDAKSCDANELVCNALEDKLKLTVRDLPDGAKIKVVAGSDNDGKLPALGISKLGTGKITITLPELLKIWDDNASIENGNSECSDYQLTMKILGDGRKLKANWNVTEDGSGITTNGAYKLFTPATAKAPFHAEGKKEPFTLRMITNPEDESDKMLRIDEIKLTAKCYPYSDNAGEGGGEIEKECEGLWCEENKIKCEGGKCVTLEETECWPMCGENELCQLGTCVPNLG